MKRYNRTAYLKLPKVEFYQLKISYDTLTVEKAILKFLLKNLLIQRKLQVILSKQQIFL